MSGGPAGGPPPDAATERLEALGARLPGAVLDLLPEPVGDDEVAHFAALQRSYPARGGKGLRGRLLLAAAYAHGADPADALPVAAALELFQNWVLVHDDVEDDSDERRGAPALHREVGVPVAINVGDAMHVAMWRALLATDAPWRDAVLHEFATTIARTAEGQHLDLAWVSEGRFDVDAAAYLAMVERKTAIYTVVAPLRLGAHVAGTPPDERFEAAGRALGAAFQIRDDVLNLEPDRGAYGKEFAGDLYEGKRTLILAHAFERLAPNDAARLQALLNRPRREKTDAEMREAHALIVSAGALASAQATAETLAAEGRATLLAALEAHTDASRRAPLVAWIDALVDRDA